MEKSLLDNDGFVMAVFGILMFGMLFALSVYFVFSNLCASSLMFAFIMAACECIMFWVMWLCVQDYHEDKYKNKL